jgi:hypothetical protein
LALCCLSFFYLIFWHCVVCPSSIWSFGHCVVCPSSIWSVAIVLPVLLLFDLLALSCLPFFYLILWALYCLSFFYLIFWHCVVCPSSIWSVGTVLSVLLKGRQLNAKRSNRRRTDNTMPTDQIEEGQTTQCQKIK